LLVLRRRLILEPRRAIDRIDFAGQLDQEQPVFSPMYATIETSFVDLAPMDDDILGSAASSGDDHHGFEGNGAFSLPVEFYQHRVPPVCFLRGAGVSSPIGGSQPRYQL
jgi:hypothetical protein